MGSDSDTGELKRRWIEVAKRVVRGERDGIPCPQNQDEFVQVEWIPFDSEPGGEWRIYCPSCNVQEFVLDRDHVEPQE